MAAFEFFVKFGSGFDKLAVDTVLHSTNTFTALVTEGLVYSLGDRRASLQPW